MADMGDLRDPSYNCERGTETWIDSSSLEVGFYGKGIKRKNMLWTTEEKPQYQE